jgi:hypothetical protein
MSSINCPFDATHLYRYTPQSIFKERISLMNAIPPPDPSRIPDIAAWIAAVLLLYAGWAISKKRVFPAFLMCLYRFFIRESVC